MIATGSEKSALEFAKGYVQNTIKLMTSDSSFQLIMLILNIMMQLSNFIKIYTAVELTKKNIKKILILFTLRWFINGNQGFVLRDKTTGVPITIDVVTPQGDFDEGNYDDARFAQEIVEDIPFNEDKINDL